MRRLDAEDDSEVGGDSVEQRIAKDMTTGPVLKQLVRFALPIALANALQAVYSLIDMIVVGRFVGPEGLSAVGIGGQLLTLYLSVGMGLGLGSQILLSQQVGAQDRDLQSTIGTLFTMELSAGVVFGVAGILLCRPMLHLLNTPPESYANATAYTLVASCGMVFIYGYNAVCGVLRGMGESKLPMIFIAIATVVNLGLDYLFVAVFRMSAGGAALATVIAQGVSFAIAIVYLYKNRERFGFDFRLRSFIPRKKRLIPILRIGSMYVVQMIMITGSMMFVNAQVNIYGVTASAVDSIGVKLNSLVHIVVGALSAAGGAVVGQCFGARKYDRIKECFRSCLLLSMGFMVILVAAYLLFPRQIFSLFSSDEAVLAMAPGFMLIAAVMDASMFTMTAPFAVVDGVGNATLGLISSILDGVVARIGLCLILGRLLGLHGFWWGNALAGFVSTLITGIYYFSGKWKYRKSLLE